MLRLKRQLGLTAIVVTHDLDLMRKVADTVVFLYKGEAIYFGPVSELRRAITRTCSSSLPWTTWK